MTLLLWCAFPLLLLACDKGNNHDSTLYESNSCGVDTPAKNKDILTGQGFNISGWAFDEFSENIPEHIRVQLTSSNGYVFSALVGTRGIERSDIAQIFKKPDLLMSGFNVPVSGNLLSPGKYKIVVEQNSKYYNLTCNPNT